MEASIIQFTGRQTLAWNVSPGDYIVWVRWKNLFDARSGVGIVDFWEIREGDEVSITSNIEDLPAWFELHPSEVSGYRACLMMQKKLDNGYKPGAPVEGPNLWRVMVGDRIVWISGVEAQDKNPTRTLVAFADNALAYGERHVHPNDVAWFLSFGAPVEDTPCERALTQVRSGLDDVRKLGLPDEIADIACGWRLGS